ncbi:alkaline phosphatase [Halomonas maura]|uniref:alkaline phosphatase n=1 Tax=Halomonas maura TaxID=117606 RepID=UPI0025B43D7D|nr:alkaline phosphatase [Halomonas maura]MDN3557941.1 alkaline phosphatase [Halomonas maura]
MNCRMMQKPATGPLLGCMMLASFTAPVQAADIKNVILMIGDGMGPQQVGFLETYAHQAPNSIYGGEPTALHRLAREGVVGTSLTYPEDAVVVDSACSATQLANGVFTGSEVIGIDADGNPVETVLELAKSRGMATGLVSDTRMTHATPAAFAAHQPHRSLENAIAEDMLSIGPEVMLSGGLRHWVPQSVNEPGEARDTLRAMMDGAYEPASQRDDERNLLDEAASQGYGLAFSRQQLEAHQGDKLLGLFANSGMADGIVYRDTRDEAQRTEPTLHEMTQAALRTLEQDEDGFFLMVEGGQIDWAGHSNDAGTMLNEMVKFEEAIQGVYDWAAERDDTVILVTADHETGSFGLSYSSANLPEPQEKSGPAFAERDYAPNFNFGDPAVLDSLYQQKDSLGNLLSRFEALPDDERTPATLMEMVNANSDFAITEEQAAAVMTDKPNPYHVEGHSYLGAEEVPAIHDFDAFYPYNDRATVLARQLGTAQNIVWGTGTHTHTPVNVFAWGPAEAILPVSSILHHSEVGEYLKSLVSRD